MKKQNNNMVEVVAKEYKEKGYNTEKNVYLKIDGEESFYIVPVVATKGSERIAIETDGTQTKKIEFLKGVYDDVVLFPSIERSEDGWFKHFCGHKWKSRVEQPKQCPGCKQYIIYK